MSAKKEIVCLSASSHVIFLFYVVVVLLTSSTISASYINGNETDHQALLNIKLMITKDPYGALTSWNSSLHFCNWNGVRCGKRHKRVTYLVLSSQGLEGLLSPHVGNLSFLRIFSLSRNSLRGLIPHDFGRLSRLRMFSLYENNFNGVIPANLSACSKLEYLSVANNKLVGSIPKEISFLSKLTFLSLGNNNLTGGIPPVLGNITSMQVFSVDENPLLGGTIPDTLGCWKGLEEIYCSDCNLYGVIPHSIYNLSLLNTIELSYNQLNGSLPLAIGVMLPRLVLLLLYLNQLTGPLPPSISNCSRLIHLEMGGNMFSGKLTINFANLRDISFIILSDNNFGSSEADEMKFIDSLKNNTKLQWLVLSNCIFQGLLPISIGNLSNQLQYLYLEENQLHGNLPRSVGNLVGLLTLSLGGNQFTGNIPSSIGNLQKIEEVRLHDNRLSGTIPNAMGNLSLLLTLWLHSNKLEGAIPKGLGNCHRLLELTLNDNKLKGEIPLGLFQLSSLSKTLNLSQNNLFGSLPLEVGDLTMLSVMDLSENNLSGHIPSSLSGCTSLSTLSLKGNFFQGMIPPSFSSMKGLVELDVSHNNLSGKIPNFLERLKYLNISYNDFEGEVPTLGVFSNTTTFSFIGNTRICGGVFELGLPKCQETNKHKKSIPLFVIVILIVLTLSIIICSAYVWCKNKSKRRLSKSLTRERYMNVSYNQLLKATNGFSEANLIGNGGFSSVYKGILDEDTDRFVAVKVLRLQTREAQRSFMRECEAWRSIRHRNLLWIITICSSIDFQGNDFKALVYEFMPNGSLHEWLHSSKDTLRLNLVLRINILLDVAYALDYMHNHCTPTLVHGDLKPSNILLDDDMVAHIGDFGLARFVGTSYSYSSTVIRGTIGYVAPEYGLGNEMTSSGDVYSYGILLLEVMTGKMPTDEIFNECLSLHKLASMALPDHVMDVIDVNILDINQKGETFMQKNEENVKKIEECLASTIKIGVSCTVDSPQERMDMKIVVHELQRITDKLQKI